MTQRRAQIPRSFTNKLRQLCQIGDAIYDEDRLILTLFNEKKFFQLAEHLNWYSKSKLSQKLKRYGFHKFRLQDKTVYRIPVRENDKKLIKMFSENSRQIKSEISTISILMASIFREKQLMNNVFQTIKSAKTEQDMFNVDQVLDDVTHSLRNWSQQCMEATERVKGIQEKQLEIYNQILFLNLSEQMNTYN